VRRTELLLPDGWKPTRNTRVEVLPDADEPVPPAGVWRIVDRSGGGPGPHWWAQPVDEQARAWAAGHGDRITSGCLEVKGLRCVPPGTPIPTGTTTSKGRRR
jgi:hypothetical protein